jgi:hypothetical protein
MADYDHEQTVRTEGPEMSLGTVNLKYTNN